MGAASWLNERERSARDDEIARLHVKLGVINMGNELLYTTIDKLEADRPLARHSHISTAQRYINVNAEQLSVAVELL